MRQLLILYYVLYLGVIAQWLRIYKKVLIPRNISINNSGNSGNNSGNSGNNSRNSGNNSGNSKEKTD
jgi:hypothetical protein